MRIIGGGLIARSLMHAPGAPDDAVVFASGVADSSCTDEAAFERECRLLAATIADAQSARETLVYFSGGGALYGTWDHPASEAGPAQPRTPYGHHQLACEEMITSGGSAYLILRLPNVVGPGANPTQLVPSLVGQVLDGRVMVQAQAGRDLIDVRDVARLVLELLGKDARKDLLNLATGHATPVPEIVAEITDILESRPIIDTIDTGVRQQFDTTALRRILGRDPFPDPDYYRTVLRQYVGDLAGELAHARA
jgi:NDP-hexose 4-ketoreductase